MTYESEEQVAENLYRNVIAQRFTEKFGKEITSNDIEHELII